MKSNKYLWAVETYSEFYGQYWPFCTYYSRDLARAAAKDLRECGESVHILKYVLSENQHN